MKIALIGAVLITLPALAAFFYAVWTRNGWLTVAAALSLSYNVIPFVLLGIMSRKAKVGDDLTGH
ncbi:MAG TPA: hypothetical protein VE913_00155 [Longimicrobium sp.]|nr:hypothetical protein [Longimicrobium sp.]